MSFHACLCAGETDFPIKIRFPLLHLQPQCCTVPSTAVLFQDSIISIQKLTANLTGQDVRGEHDI